MGTCQGKSALGDGDVLAKKKPKRKSFRHSNGSFKTPQVNAQTYPVDVPILAEDVDLEAPINGHRHFPVSERKQPLQSKENNDDVFISADFPSYGPTISPSESCDPDTPLPNEAESSVSCDHGSEGSPASDSPVISDSRRIPTSDSGIYSISQSPVREMSPHRVAVEEAKTRFLQSTVEEIHQEAPPPVKRICENTGDANNSRTKDNCMYCTSTCDGSLDNIVEEKPKPTPPSNLPVKRFLKHQGLPPTRPTSESRFSFKRFKKRKMAEQLSKHSSWKSQDGFDLNSSLRTGLSQLGNECSEMCLCDELLDLEAPLAQFDSILTMYSPSCASLNRLPQLDPITDSNVRTCIICKGAHSSQDNKQSDIDPSIPCDCQDQLDSKIRSTSIDSENSLDSPTSHNTEYPEFSMVCIDDKEMVVLEPETYNQLLTDLALVKYKLQRIYNLLLQEEFGSISDIINNSGLESCLLDY